MQRSHRALIAALITLVAGSLFACGSAPSLSNVTAIDDSDPVKLIPLNTLMSFQKPSNLAPDTFRYYYASGQSSVDTWFEYEPNENDRLIPTTSTFKVVDKRVSVNDSVFTMVSQGNGFVIRLTVANFKKSYGSDYRTRIEFLRKYINITLPKPTVIE